MGEAVSVSDVTLPNSFPKVRSGWRCHLHGATYKTGGCWPGRGLGWLLLSPSFVFLLLGACWQPNPARTPGWQLPGTALPCLGRAQDGPCHAWAGLGMALPLLRASATPGQGVLSAPASPLCSVPQGWSSAYSIESVIMQISATLVKGKARVQFGANKVGPGRRKRA